MTEYEFCLGLGFLGLAVMAFGGLFSRGAGRDNDVSNVSLPGHGGGAHSVGGAHAPAAHLPTHSAPSTLALGRAGGVRGGAAIVAGAKATRGGAAGRRVLGWLSPRVMFSVLVGFGAAGLAMQGYVAEPIRLVVAVVLGVLFEVAAVGPVWRLVLGFGSAPARTLEQCLNAEARAESGFDAHGQGLISIELDGQVVQVLGTLCKEDREAEVKVRAGDRLLVEDVDARRNRCTVSRRGVLSLRVEESRMSQVVALVAVLLVVLVFIPLIVASLLKNVEAGTIRMVSWLQGSTVIYRGPGKSKEIPLLTTGTTLSSKAINVDLDITDQTADIDENGTPRPIKVRVLASAIVSVGDTDTLIKTAANRFFSKNTADQENILIDLLSSSGRRAINLLTHDQLFSAKVATPSGDGAAMVRAESAAIVRAQNEAITRAGGIADLEDDDDPLAVIIRKACSRELTDLGLTFNSLNIKVVQSEVAEARRRQSAAEAQANADIVAAQQARRAKEAQIEAERIISDKRRELEQTRASNAALIAVAEAKTQEAMAGQRIAELDATQIAQAKADAERVRIQAQAAAQAEAIRITTVADATAESIQKVNRAIAAGGEAYFRYRQIEMLPDLVPALADALSQAKLVTIASGDTEGGAPNATMQNITSVIQTVLAAQFVSRSGMGDPSPAAPAQRPAPATTPTPPPAPHTPPAPQLPASDLPRSYSVSTPPAGNPSGTPQR